MLRLTVTDDRGRRHPLGAYEQAWHILPPDARKALDRAEQISAGGARGLAVGAATVIVVWLLIGLWRGGWAGLFADPTILAPLSMFIAAAVVLVVLRVRVGAQAAQNATGMCLSARLCPACGYDLIHLPPDPDGCTTCPECGAAWRVPADQASRS